MNVSRLGYLKRSASARITKRRSPLAASSIFVPARGLDTRDMNISSWEFRHAWLNFSGRENFSAPCREADEMVRNASDDVEKPEMPQCQPQVYIPAFCRAAVRLADERN
jgi:hypothetical protein